MRNVEKCTTFQKELSLKNKRPRLRRGGLKTGAADELGPTEN
jgi:hypothetical protein